MSGRKELIKAVCLTFRRENRKEQRQGQWAGRWVRRQEGREKETRTAGVGGWVGGGTWQGYPENASCARDPKPQSLCLGTAWATLQPGPSPQLTRAVLCSLEKWEPCLRHLFLGRSDDSWDVDLQKL